MQPNQNRNNKKDKKMSKLHDLIDAIADGKSVDIQQHFESIMTDKMVNAIEQRKYEVAQTLFSESVDESVLLDDISELTEEEAAAFIDSLDEAELEKLDELSKATLGSYVDKRIT